jgi:hypothetical protein
MLRNVQNAHRLMLSYPAQLDKVPPQHVHKVKSLDAKVLTDDTSDYTCRSIIDSEKLLAVITM